MLTNLLLLLPLCGLGLVGRLPNKRGDADEGPVLFKHTRNVCHRLAIRRKDNHPCITRVLCGLEVARNHFLQLVQLRMPFELAST